MECCERLTLDKTMGDRKPLIKEIAARWSLRCVPLSDRSHSDLIHDTCLKKALRGLVDSIKDGRSSFLICHN
jgi:hypothetical protein